MAHPALVDETTLMEWSDAKQRAKLMEWLNRNGIRYHINRAGKVCSTVDAINASLIGQKADNDDVEFE